MTVPASPAVPRRAIRLSRSFAAALFTVCVGLAALPGCGGPAPKAEKKDDKKEDPKPDPGPAPAPGSNPGPGPAPTPDVPPKSTLGSVDKAADDAATAFRRELVQGAAKADALSAAFLKVIGKPLAFESDKAKGYSADNATSWLKKVGDGLQFGPEMKRPDQVGEVVYLRGALQGKPGGYSLRLVKEGAAWKVDWLSLSSAEGTVTAPQTPEGTAQGFAVAAFLESITDLNAMPKEERHLLIAATMTKELRAAWSPLVFDQDKAAGYDYGPAKLATAAVNLGGGTTAFTATRDANAPEFKVELTRPAGKKGFTVRLVKGPGPHDWLVSEIVEPKG